MRVQNKDASSSGLNTLAVEARRNATIELPNKETIVKSSTYTNIQFVKA